MIIGVGIFKKFSFEILKIDLLQKLIYDEKNNRGGTTQLKIKCPHKDCNQKIDTKGKEMPYFEKLLSGRFSKIFSWLSRLTKIGFIDKIGSKFSKNSITMKCPRCKHLFELSQDGQVNLTKPDQRRENINASIKLLASNYQ